MPAMKNNFSKKNQIFVLIVGMDKILFFSPEHPELKWKISSIVFNACRVKRPRREAKKSLFCSAEYKNHCSQFSVLPHEQEQFSNSLTAISLHCLMYSVQWA
jgi:hypothetical protein